MDSKKVKSLRGRPKTVDRDHILEVAMLAYWGESVAEISVNEICRRAKVSKPGLYREFGNEDGLMKAVLLSYQKKVLIPLMQSVSGMPFREALDNLVLFVTSDNPEVPRGCLMVKMRESRLHLGEVTREQIDETHAEVLKAYEGWIAASKEKGEFRAEMSAEFAATYIDAQLSNALSQLARGDQSNTVGAILTMAFSVL